MREEELYGVAGEREILRVDLDRLDGLWAKLRHVKIIGGEPMIIPEHEEFLRRLSERSDPTRVSLEYATNGTTRVSDFVLETWSRLQGLTIAFSVDGLRERNDFFRDGSRWESVIQNIHWFREHVRCRDLSFHIHTVVSIYNVHEIVELDAWLLAEFPDFWLVKDCLVNPDWLHIANLPGVEKERLRNHFQAASQEAGLARKRKSGYELIQGVLGREASADFSSFIAMHKKMNALRGSDPSVLAPQLLRLLEGA
jgi:hypothetical protein